MVTLYKSHRVLKGHCEGCIKVTLYKSHRVLKGTNTKQCEGCIKVTLNESIIDLYAIYSI